MKLLQITLILAMGGASLATLLTSQTLHADERSGACVQHIVATPSLPDIG